MKNEDHKTIFPPEVPKFGYRRRADQASTKMFNTCVFEGVLYNVFSVIRVFSHFQYQYFLKRL